MTLIKNISGFRGTIGGENNNNLTPVDIVSSIAGFSKLIKENNPNNNLTVMTGRDGRKSGEMIQNIVNSVFSSMGINVIDAGLSTTPTLCWGVLNNDSVAGLMITASHNPQEYNGLKFFNSEGEFLSKEDVTKVIEYSKLKTYDFAPNASLGTINKYDHLIDDHIEAIINLEILPLKRIKELNLYVVADAINSGGAIALPKLLEKLNIRYKIINSEIEGVFNHTPEPLEENLKDLSQEIIKNNADFGIAVDPDVDRLAFMDENGVMFGEEYTLVACADHILSHKPGNTVSNLSSTRALRDVTQKYGGTYTASAVGEVNVVNAMKSSNAIIGGEGNGGIIYPKSHYGRDALVGVALFLSLLAERKIAVSNLRASYPSYFMSKKKIDLNPSINVDAILEAMESKYIHEEISTIDGLKIDFPTEWVHLRKSNTEPIIRIYTEAPAQDKADALADKIINEIKKIAGL